MDLNAQKEKFSEAYVRAVAATAGFGIGQPEIDDDSVDLTIYGRGRNGKNRSPRLDIQLKCTAKTETIDEKDFFSFKLKIKNYNDLIGEDFLTPRLLIVVRVPEEPIDWTTSTEEELLLRHCGYWISLRDHPATDNTCSVTLKIPREQIFSVNALKTLMTRIGNGDIP
ncbi:MAG: DUF4365 domain-containing protein [Magnetococcales bacterium]|nr:DUF4365 domain-containing protein [Magnetococcales bacterium]